MALLGLSTSRLVLLVLWGIHEYSKIPVVTSFVVYRPNDSSISTSGWQSRRRRFRHSRTAPIVELSPSQRTAQWFADRQIASSGSSRSTTTSSSSSVTVTHASFASVIDVGPCIGSGSYGTVHYITALVIGKGEDGEPVRDRVTVIGKRAWTQQELQSRNYLFAMEELQQKAARCNYYWSVEKHCFEKMLYAKGLPEYLGTVTDNQQRTWMLFDILEAPPTVSAQLQSSVSTATVSAAKSVPSSLAAASIGKPPPRFTKVTPPPPPSTAAAIIGGNGGGGGSWRYGTVIAPSLATLMELDRVDPRQENGKRHHLYSTSQALLLNNGEDSLAATLDVVLEQVLEILSHVHSHSIVHRDVKPSNVLVAHKDGVSRIVLIDFGSAGDVSTFGMLKKNIGMKGGRVSVSPMYSAPEVFVGGSDLENAVNFDSFSAAQLYLQLLFQYLDERTEAGFHQQLSKARWDLDVWLHMELQAKIRPAGLDHALEVLEDRPGLWKLLQDMLRANPSKRISSSDALERWKKVKENALRPGTRLVKEQPDPDLNDGQFLLDVLDARKRCEIPPVWPLHFVATFDREETMGLFLAEADSEVSEMDEVSLQKWEAATADALPGDVFVQDIYPGSQAEQMGIFAVGDRLQGVGEIPLGGGGFEKAVATIKGQPKSVGHVTLHFDRKSAWIKSRDDLNMTNSSTGGGPTQVVDQGAWSITGRREMQEDAYILTEVNDRSQRSVVLAGVFDGHCGNVASRFVESELPDVFAGLLSDRGNTPVQSLLDSAWNQCCDNYRYLCMTEDECIPRYDPVEGVLMAQTGSQDIVGGTTASIFALDEQRGALAVLNCGDSRGIVIDSSGDLVFQTTDHTPQSELERLASGAKQGLPFSVPECHVGKWVLRVGRFEYTVARALQGPFVTSKGITSMADISVLKAEPGMTVVVATDGLWEKVDSAEVARIVTQRKNQNGSAGDTAKALCSLALDKESEDNVSVVVMYLA